MKQLLGVVLLVLLSVQLKGQIISERPGQAYSPICLDSGQVQIQTGTILSSWNYTGPVIMVYPAPITSKTSSVQNTVIRIGMGDLFELNGSFDYSFTEEQFFTPKLGLKAKLISSENHHLAIQYNAGLGQYNTSLFSNDIFLISSHQFTNWFSVGLNFGIKNTFAEETTHPSHVVSLGFAPSNRITLIVEQYSNFLDQGYHYFDAGIAFLVTNNFQIDTYFGGGINHNEEEIFINSGISYKFGLRK